MQLQLPNLRPIIASDFVRTRRCPANMDFKCSNTRYKQDGDGNLRALEANMPALNFTKDGVCTGMETRPRVKNLCDDSELQTNWSGYAFNQGFETLAETPTRTTNVRTITSTGGSGQINRPFPTANFQRFGKHCYISASAIVKARANTTGFCMIVLGRNGSIYPDASFNIVDGTLMGAYTRGSDFDQITQSIDDLGNGWYRCGIVCRTSSDAMPPNIMLHMYPDNVTGIINDLKGQSIYICGVQVHDEPHIGPFIKTSTATVVADYELPSFKAPDALTQASAVFDFTALSFSVADTSIFEFGDSSGVAQTNTVSAIHDSGSGSIILRKRINGVSIIERFEHQLTFGVRYRAVMFWDQNTMGLYLTDGVTEHEFIASIDGSPPNVQHVRLGWRGVNNNAGAYMFERVYVYPRRINSEEVRGWLDNF